VPFAKLAIFYQGESLVEVVVIGRKFGWFDFRYVERCSDNKAGSTDIWTEVEKWLSRCGGALQGFETSSTPGEAGLPKSWNSFKYTSLLGSIQALKRRNDLGFDFIKSRLRSFL
jgi:hypothetical protein